jgi:DHA2 family multidrug resistance protein
LGPVIGGYITDTLNWHWLFFINLVPGLLVAGGVAAMVKIDKADFSLLREADYIGILLMAVGLGTLEYFLEEGTRWNWFSDSTITACAWVAGLSLLAFIIRSMMVKNPVVDFRAFGNRNFALGCFLSFVTGIGIFSTIYLTPLFLGYVRGFSAWQTGMAIFSTGAASILGVPFYIAAARKLDTRWLMMAGLAMFGIAMWRFSLITHDWGGDQLFWPQVLRGFPQVWCVAPAVTLGLATNLTAASGPMNRLLAGMTSRFSAALGSPVAGHQAALRTLWALTYREAQTLSYADAFRAVMVAFIIAACLVPLMRKVVPPSAPAVAGH